MRTQRIDQEIFDILKRQFKDGKGVSRHAKKQKGVFSAQTNTVHAKDTFETYRQQSKTFAKYARGTLGIRRLKDLQLTDVGKWLEYRQECGDSASTLKTRAAAMAKVLQCSSTDFGFKSPIRNSDEIKRSRLPVKMDKRLNEEIHADILMVAKGTGMRRVELQRLKPEQLEIRDRQAYITGVHGKNGLERTLPVLKKYNDAVIAIIERCETSKVFPFKIPAYIDVHSYRGEYAKAMYDQILAEKKEKGEEIKLDYHTRGAVRISLDRSIVGEVSKTLGHKRIGVTVTNYLKHHFA